LLSAEPPEASKRRPTGTSLIPPRLLLLHPVSIP
jgi:hypothetical protein